MRTNLEISLPSSSPPCPKKQFAWLSFSFSPFGYEKLKNDSSNFMGTLHFMVLHFTPFIPSGFIIWNFFGGGMGETVKIGNFSGIVCCWSLGIRSPFHMALKRICDFFFLRILNDRISTLIDHDALWLKTKF